MMDGAGTHNERSKGGHPPAYATAAALSFFSLLFCLTLLAGCATQTPQPLRSFPTPKTALTGIEVGMRCPNLVFEDEQGRIRKLQDYRGKIVFMNFWASWCIPCQREMPSIQKLYDELKNDEGIVFLLFNAGKDSAASKKWARALGYDIPLYLSSPSGDRPLITVPTIPRTLILDRNGIVIMSKTGEVHWTHWSERIRDLIKASATTPGRHLSFPADGVRIKVDVMEGKPDSDLHLSLVPQKGVKLSAKRGIIVTPAGGGSVEWLTPLPLTRIDEEIDYFPAVPELALRFRSPADSSRIVLEIEYGYCRTDSDLCVPAKAVIEVPVYRQD